jgi:hypothetical protein
MGKRQTLATILFSRRTAFLIPGKDAETVKPSDLLVVGSAKSIYEHGETKHVAAHH